MNLKPLGHITLSKESISELKEGLKNEIFVLNQELKKKYLSVKQKNVLNWKKLLQEKELQQIKKSGTYNSLFRSVIQTITFNVLKNIANSKDKINDSNRLRQYKNISNHSSKCAAVLTNRLLKGHNRKFNNKELYFEILNYLRETKWISKAEYNFCFNYHPATWTYSGFGFDGKYLDNCEELVWERVEEALQNSDYYVSSDEELKELESKIFDTVLKTISDIYLRKLKSSIEDETELDIPIDDWEFGKNLIDFTIHILNEKLCHNAFNPLLQKDVNKSKRSKTQIKSLAKKVRHVVKKCGKKKFQQIDGKKARADKLIKLLINHYEDEITDDMIKSQYQSITRYAAMDWIAKEVNSHDKK